MHNLNCIKLHLEDDEGKPDLNHFSVKSSDTINMIQLIYNTRARHEQAPLLTCLLCLLYIHRNLSDTKKQLF